MAGATPHASLRGVKVLQIASLLPGPLCGKLLCDLGADVVMVENKRTGGDPLRNSLFGTAGRPIFEALNRGKSSLSIDFKNRADVDDFHANWVRFADVVILSVRPGSLDEYGLSPRELRQRHASLIVCCLTGYGWEQTPLAQRAGHDLNYLAHAGVLGMSAEPCHPLPVQVADVMGSHAALSHILAALIHRSRTKRGCTLDIAMADVAAHMLIASEPFRAAVAGVVDVTRGGFPLCGSAPCYNVYPTKDGRSVVIAALEHRYWVRVVAFLNLPVEYGDPGAQFGMEEELRKTVMTTIAAATRKHTFAEWRCKLEKVDIMMDVVLLPGEAASSQHFVQRLEARRQIKHDTIPSAFWRFNGISEESGIAAPRVGNVGVDEKIWGNLTNGFNDQPMTLQTTVTTARAKL